MRRPRSRSTARRHQIGRLLCVVLAAGWWLGAQCEQQDFEKVDTVFTVESDADVLEHEVREVVTHDMIARHSVDYRVESQAAIDTEVVVFARSRINGVERANGHAVLRLEPGEQIEGRLSDLQLEVGDQLDLALQCCAASACEPSDVVCGLASGDADSTALVCLDGCDDIESCRESCDGRTAASCDCDEDDAACLDACVSSCKSDCGVTAMRCASNCISLHRRCTQTSAPDVGSVPCALCDAGEGLCDPSTFSGIGCEPGADGVPWTCSALPDVCMTGCNDPAVAGDDPSARLSCLESCLLLHQRACGLDTTRVSANISSPCCFSTTCAASMDAIVKLGALECFADADCGSSRRCNDRGLCENQLREEQSGCSVVGLSRRPGDIGGDHGARRVVPCALAVFFLLWWRWRSRARRRARGRGSDRRSRSGPWQARARRRVGGRESKRRSRSGPWRGWLLVGLFLLGLGGVLTPSSASAEPPGFRQTRSTFVIGLTTGTFLANEMGTATLAGLGLSAQQTISSGYFGGSFRIGASIYATEGAGLPFDNGMQAYYVAAGPRFRFPTFDEIELYLFLQPEYVYEGLQSNTLVDVTDGEGVLHGPGGLLGAQMMLGPAVIQLDAGFGWMFPVQSGELTVTLGAGFTGFL